MCIFIITVFKSQRISQFSITTKAKYLLWFSSLNGHNWWLPTTKKINTEGTEDFTLRKQTSSYPKGQLPNYTNGMKNTFSVIVLFMDANILSCQWVRILFPTRWPNDLLDQWNMFQCVGCQFQAGILRTRLCFLLELMVTNIPGGGWPNSLGPKRNNCSIVTAYIK